MYKYIQASSVNTALSAAAAAKTNIVAQFTLWQCKTQLISIECNVNHINMSTVSVNGLFCL